MTKFVYTFDGKTVERKFHMENSPSGKVANPTKNILSGRLSIFPGLIITTYTCKTY